jgi:hypothetical protein
LIFINKEEKKIDCFVIMPITVPLHMLENKIYDDKNHFKNVFDYIIKPAIERNDWNPIYPKTKGSEIIIGDIIGNIIKSEMAVCDISILNPNVFYEAGIRTALNKPIAYIKDDAIDTIPFDTSEINHETYRKSLKIHNAEEDISKLQEHLKETFKKSNYENTAWKKFGVKIKAEQPTSDLSPINAKMDLIMDRLNQMEIENKNISSNEVIEYQKEIKKSPYERKRQKSFIDEIFGNNLGRGISKMNFEGKDAFIVYKENFEPTLENEDKIRIIAKKFGYHPIILA